ncbi:hypothetical protein LCGC14_2282900 [marine sediment metagenome]|uniref:Uncharacterized protein n=1 Tax=marine sediment metagenome TaxID=412755 RepID=A0A0F9DFY1_9ZZZZ
MMLQTELDVFLPRAKDTIYHSVIERYLQGANPVAFKEVIVWGNKTRSFRCQAVVDGEVFGHVFKIDVANETLLPV